MHDQNPRLPDSPRNIALVFLLSSAPIRTVALWTMIQAATERAPCPILKKEVRVNRIRSALCDG